MIYYKSKELSKNSGINAAKWKRWVREFLPPDPLSGLQSGYARQFNLKDAFRVYLGGHLIQSMKFGVDEARSILTDLHGWLQRGGFFDLTAANGDLHKHQDGLHHRVYIIPLGGRGFGYVIRSVRDSDGCYQNTGECSEKYELTLIKVPEDLIATGAMSSARVIGISRLYREFLIQITSGK